MTGESQFLFVAPKHGGSGFDDRLGQHVMQDDNLVSAFVAHDEKHRPLVQSHARLQQRPNTIVDFLLHC